MKTPEEILGSYELNHNGMPWYRKSTVINAMEAYHAQFQSQPSISAEDFLKEKGIYDETDRLKHIPMKNEFVKLLTEFASRQGKMVDKRSLIKWNGCIVSENRLLRIGDLTHQGIITEIIEDTHPRFNTKNGSFAPEDLIYISTGDEKN